MIFLKCILDIYFAMCLIFIGLEGSKIIFFLDFYSFYCFREKMLKDQPALSCCVTMKATKRLSIVLSLILPALRKLKQLLYLE